MRIISGFYKGRKLVLPTNFVMRPTTDMAKESLFNVLSNQVDFDETDALDLFSGTGSISYELASRGVKSVLAVEHNAAQVRFIESVILKLEIENMRILRMDVFQFFKTNKRSFDLVFADPPYDMPDFENLPDLIFSHKLLNPNGIFVLEHSKNHSFTKNTEFFEHRKYGNVQFSFFQNLKETV